MARKGIQDCLGLVVLVLLASVNIRCQTIQPSSTVKAIAPSDKHDHTAQLKRKLIEAREELERLKKTEADEAKAAKYEAFADDIVRHALDQKNQTTQYLQLQMANEIIRDPVHTMRALQRKLAARAKAKMALDKAKAETDPKLQVKLLEEAENQVWVYKTGKKPIKKTQVPKVEDEEVLTEDQVVGLFGEELDRFADKVAQKLILKANSMLDDKTRNETLLLASNILAHPKENIKEFVRKREIKAHADSLLFNMRKALKKINDPKKRALIRTRMTVLEINPVGFHDKLVKEEEEKIITKSKAIGQKLILDAEDAEDVKKAESMIELGKLYLNYPLDYWGNLTEIKEKKKFLEAAPAQCQLYVHNVYHFGEDALDTAFRELVAPPPPPPVTGIVNFAQTGARTTTFTSKKARLANDDFGFEKRYIKISFTGWMKRNSELKEKDPDKLTQKKTLAKEVKTK
jgi:hypothetical protein